MRQRTSLLEWQFVENTGDLQDAPWPPLVDRLPSTPATRSHLHRRYVWGGSIALFLLLATTSTWLWRRAEAGLNQVEWELKDAVQLELVSDMPDRAQPMVNWPTGAAANIWQSQLEREQDTLFASSILEAPKTVPNPTVHLINLQNDLAVANFVTSTQDEGRAFRQVRFYRQTADGWLRTTPQAELWGTPRQLESSHFVFHFRQNDAQVVAAVAPQMDALYTELQRNFGLAPSLDRLVIEVTVERLPGTVVAPSWVDEPLVVPSPALYLVPVELSDNEILAQSIALPLIDYMARRFTEKHAIPPQWQPLRSGIKLWQLWDLELPLSPWRDEVVTWLYNETPANRLKQHSAQLDTYQDLCTMHRLWMLSPVLIGIPLECPSREEGSWPKIRRLAQEPPMHLYALTTPLSGYGYGSYDEDIYFFRSTHVVAIATLIEYAVATYGYEQLPTLLASLAQHDDWETLLPAVYGVSSAEFEEGWRAYLTARYR